MAYKPKAGEVMANINIIPMADIMLVLLIIFMVVTPMLQKGHPVERAPVSKPHEMQAADKEDAVVVAITRDGAIYLGTIKVKKEDLTKLVKEKLAAASDKTVFVSSDRATKYGLVVEVVDEIRSAGVDALGLLTEKTQTGKQLPPPPPTGG